jgi:hypothetical protein
VTTACAPQRKSGIANVFAYHVHDHFLPNESTSQSPCRESESAFSSELTEQLTTLKIPEAAVQVLALAPLAHAAWAHDSLASSKRHLALNAVNLTGLGRNSVTYQLLEDWLCHRPDPSMMTVWCDYVGALQWILSEESLRELQHVTMERTKAILKATSCCFGIGRLSQSDRMVLNKVESAFSS